MTECAPHVYYSRGVKKAFWQKVELRGFVTRPTDCTISVAKTKALISFAATAKLICVFVFAYAECWFSHAAAKISFLLLFSLVWTVMVGCSSDRSGTQTVLATEAG